MKPPRRSKPGKMPLSAPPMAPAIKPPSLPSSKPRRQTVTPVATDRGAFGIKG